MELSKARNALLAPIRAEHVIAELRHALDKGSAPVAVIEPLAYFSAMSHFAMQLSLKLCPAEKENLELQAARMSGL